MKKLINKVRKQDTATKVGLYVLVVMILPVVAILINEILIKDSVLHY